MRITAAVALALVVAACGSETVIDTTLPIQATVVTEATTTTTTVATSTTTSSTNAAPTSQFDRITLVGECSSEPGETPSYQLTAQAFGQVESQGTGAITWNGSEIATLGVELDKNGEWTETVDVAEPGSGVLSVSSDGGAIIYSASLSVSACEVAEPEPFYELTLAAGAYCLEFYPYIEIVVDSEPYYDEDEPLVVLTFDTDDDVMVSEDTYSFVGDPLSLDMGGVSGEVYLFAVDAFGTSSNAVTVSISECFIADVSIISAIATCGPDEDWTLAVELNGRPGATGSMFYSWEGALDGEIWNFTLDENGSWNFTGSWPDGHIDGIVSLDLASSGNVPVQLHECGE